MSQFRNQVAKLHSEQKRAIGDPYIYAPAEGDPPVPSAVLTPAEGIFEREFAQADLLSGIQLDRTGPMIDVVLIDLPQKPLQGDFIEYDGEVFTVASEQPDGRGMSTLMLTLDTSRVSLP